MSETFGERLKKARQSMNLTQQDMADKLNVVRATVTMWETDRNSPDIDSLKKIAGILNISIDHLLGVEKNDDLPEFIKQKLSKLDTIEQTNLKEKLKQIGTELINLSDKL